RGLEVFLCRARSGSFRREGSTQTQPIVDPPRKSPRPRPARALRGHSSEPPPTTGVLREVASLRCGPREGQGWAVELELVDVGSVPKLDAKSASYQPYLETIDAVVVVLDATKTAVRFRQDEVEKTKRLLHTMAREPELRGKPFLVLANKCDRQDALTVEEVVDSFGLGDAMRGRAWHLQRCSAVTAEGLQAACSWLTLRLLEEARPEMHGVGSGGL
ncbi:unnamed protein product, partial [Prorocentrum cordatum]